MSELQEITRELQTQLINVARNAGQGVEVTSASFATYEALQEGTIRIEIKVDGKKLRPVDQTDYSNDDMPF